MLQTSMVCAASHSRTPYNIVIMSVAHDNPVRYWDRVRLEISANIYEIWRIRRRDLLIVNKAVALIVGQSMSIKSNVLPSNYFKPKRRDKRKFGNTMQDTSW